MSLLRNALLYVSTGVSIILIVALIFCYIFDKPLHTRNYKYRISELEDEYLPKESNDQN